MSEEKKPVEITGSFKVEVVGKVASAVLDNQEAFVEAAKGQGITKVVLEDVQRFQKAYIDAAGEKAVEEGKKILKGNKDLDSVSLQAPYTTNANGSVAYTVTREKTFTPGFGSGEPVTKSTIRTVITDPYAKPTQKFIKGLEAMLTKDLLGIDLK